MKLPADKIEALSNANLSIGEKISLYNCNIWPKLPYANESLAEGNRIQGNELYKSMQYNEAIYKYNLSLCQSSSIESRGKAYANRAAAYLGLSLYRDCLDSVRLAKECALPTNLLRKVAAREKMALERLESEILDNNEPIELSYRRHKRISSFVYCLTPLKPRNLMQGIITNENLLPGDVLIVEPPVMIISGSVNECTNCLRKCGSLQPCECSYMFCSQECKAEAFATYHKYECPLAEFLLSYATDELLVLRVFFKLIQRFKDVQSLRIYLENITSDPNPFDDFEFWPNRGGDTFESQFRVYFGNQPKNLYTNGLMWQNLCAKTAIVIDLLRNVKQIPLAAQTTDEWSFLSEQLYRLFIYNNWSVNWNMKSYLRNQIRYVRNVNGGVEMEVQCLKENSIAIHGYASLIRSTKTQDPNVLMDYVEGVLIVRAMKSISSGTELLCSSE